MSRIDGRFSFFAILPALASELAITNQWKRGFDKTPLWIVLVATFVCAPVAGITIVGRMGEQSFWLKFMAPILLRQLPFTITLEQERQKTNARNALEKREQERILNEHTQN